MFNEYYFKKLLFFPGLSTFRMQAFSRYQPINLNYAVQNSSYDFVSIKQALSSNELISIRCFIIQLNSPMVYETQGSSYTSTFVLIGDESGTAYLCAKNLKEEQIKIEQSFTMTNIRKKTLNGSNILSTTIDTRFELSDTVNEHIFAFLNTILALVSFRTYLHCLMILTIHYVLIYRR